MKSNKVPEGKTVWIEGRKFKEGDSLPAWALLEIPEEKELEIVEEPEEQEEPPIEVLEMNKETIETVLEEIKEDNADNNEVVEIKEEPDFRRSKNKRKKKR